VGGESTKERLFLREFSFYLRFFFGKKSARGVLGVIERKISKAIKNVIQRSGGNPKTIVRRKSPCGGNSVRAGEETSHGSFIYNTKGGGRGDFYGDSLSRSSHPSAPRHKKEGIFREFGIATNRACAGRGGGYIGKGFHQNR